MSFPLLVVSANDPPDTVHPALWYTQSEWLWEEPIENSAAPTIIAELMSPLNVPFLQNMQVENLDPAHL